MIKLIKILKKEAPEDKGGDSPDGEASLNGNAAAAHDYDSLGDFIKLKRENRDINTNDLTIVKSSLYGISKTPDKQK